MSPETLMRAYRDCLIYIGGTMVNVCQINSIAGRKYKRGCRLAKKLEARILKYASAGYAARTRYLHTRGYMKIKPAIVYETQLQHRTECFPVFDATKHVGPVEEPTIDVQQLFLDRIKTAGDEYREKLSEFYKKKELDAAMVSASDEIADTIMRTNPILSSMKD